jgi:diadenosine tetraphosphate (Ap4A) HIT family hydrolase
VPRISKVRASFFWPVPLKFVELLQLARQGILDRDASVEGFNVGVNTGKAAGQTVMHCHVHLIPRRGGDVPNPRGGYMA